MMGTSRKILNFVIALNVFLLVGVVLSYYGVSRWHNSIIESEKQLFEEKAKVSSVEALGNLLDNTKENREYISKLFVDKETAVDFLDFIESVGNLSQAEVTVESVTPQETENSGGFVSVRFNAKGTWPQIVSTLALADHIAKALVVSSVQVVREKDDNPMSEATAVATTTGSGKGKQVAKPSVWKASFDVKVLKTPNSK